MVTCPQCGDIFDLRGYLEFCPHALRPKRKRKGATMRQNATTTNVAITRPTPAYDILTWVQEHILEEHRRLRMGIWCNRRADVPDEDKAVYNEAYNYPRCGTVACEAGWIGLRCGIKVDRGLPSIDGNRISWSDMSEIIAGFCAEAQEELGRSFLGGYHYDLEDGTREQAKATAEVIEGFKRKWKRELKARIILPGGVVQGEERKDIV